MAKRTKREGETASSNLLVDVGAFLGGRRAWESGFLPDSALACPARRGCKRVDFTDPRGPAKVQHLDPIVQNLQSQFGGDVGREPCRRVASRVTPVAYAAAPRGVPASADALDRQMPCTRRAAKRPRRSKCCQNPAGCHYHNEEWRASGNSHHRNAGATGGASHQRELPRHWRPLTQLPVAHEFLKPSQTGFTIGLLARPGPSPCALRTDGQSR